MKVVGLDGLKKRYHNGRSESKTALGNIIAQMSVIRTADIADLAEQQ
jgi:hypothetical protein